MLVSYSHNLRLELLRAHVEVYQLKEVQVKAALEAERVKVEVEREDLAEEIYEQYGVEIDSLSRLAEGEWAYEKEGDPVHAG